MYENTAYYIFRFHQSISSFLLLYSLPQGLLYAQLCFYSFL